MRQDGGRPSPGMRPRVLTTLGRELSPALTVLLVPKEPEESTAFFRFQVQKTHDPREIYEKRARVSAGGLFSAAEGRSAIG